MVHSGKCLQVTARHKYRRCGVTHSHVHSFFLILHLYFATSKLVLRRGGPKQDPTLNGVSTEDTEDMWP